MGPGRGGELGSITQSTMSTYDMPGGVDTGDADLNKTLALPLGAHELLEEPEMAFGV